MLRQTGPFILALAALCLADAAGAQAPLTVDVVTARPKAEAQTFSLTGEIAAHDTLSASFPAGGRISEIMVNEGDTVAAGTPLARIDSVQQEQQLRAAQAGLATAQAGLRKAREDSTRQDALLERGATTRSARDAAADKLRAAEATVAQARADLDRAKKAVSDTVLTAPATATVITRSAEPGQVVGAAQPVLKLALGHDYDAIFDVPEVMLTSLPPAPRVTLRQLNRPGPAFHGAIREVSPLIDPRKGTVKVTVKVTDPPANLTYGEAVTGSVTFTGKARIALPWSAMSATEKGPAVWVMDPATKAVSLRQIEVLRYETGRIVLSGGLTDGEQVVTQGSSLLFPGEIVRPVEDK